MPIRSYSVILTHEHTDFDALASMLGAGLIFPGAVPILPRQLNRNVASFITLYKNQLPFVAVEDAPHSNIRQVILVDTRAASQPRGVRKNARYVVIDHHANHDSNHNHGEVSKPLPANWELWAEAVGANTTLLVERLIEQQSRPTPVQATLLALGIHEDTGSLTYVSTTARDVRCLAWLMECGANLNELSHFLHHPLSEDQRQLLEQLIEESEMLEIAGHSVVIAQAEALGFAEEISALAGRLRDFFESDAIFLLITLGDIVQVVARSTTDAIDVGQIARQLGGGGHRRAAAAPVHQTPMSEVRRAIIGALEQQSRSGITVGEIMSRGRPQMLGPDLRIDAAADLMRRYGHEGFPVIEQVAGSERLLGVFTRREADRAISHGLHKEPVRRFMRAGAITVRPTESISQLRRLMIDNDWGQIPVVNDEGQIIGIVTRTDLIKLWDEAHLPDHRAPDVAQQLRRTLTPIQHHLLQVVGEEVSHHQQNAYVVGGFVRDLLLRDEERKKSGEQRPESRGPTTHYVLRTTSSTIHNSQFAISSPFDLDIVIEGDAIDFAYAMQGKYGGRVVMHRQFGTAKWILDDGDAVVDRNLLLADLPELERNGSLPPNLDFVSARTEFYTAPTALPTVESGGIKLDLHRRDFTINTLALCINPARWGVLLDFYGGVADLEKGIVRVLHSLSFVDDPTRILRAVRYEQRFGFHIEERTLELLGDALDLIERVTPARIRHELQRIFDESQPENVLIRLGELGVLAQIHPDFQTNGWLVDCFVRLRALVDGSTPAPDWVQRNLAAEPLARLYWALLVFRLPIESIQQMNERLHWDKATQRLAIQLHAVEQSIEALRLFALSPSRVTLLLEAADLHALALFTLVHSGDERLEALIHRYHDEWRHVRPLLNGEDLATMKIAKGPIYSRILDGLRRAKLDGEVPSREAEEAWVLRMIDGGW